MKKVLSLMVLAGLYVMHACGPSADEAAVAEKAKTDSIAEEAREADERAAKEAATADSLEKAKVIIKMFTRRGEIFEQPCESVILLCIKSGAVSAVAKNCENEYGVFDYYSGNVVDLKITGKASLFDNCGGSGEGPEMCMTNNQFVMQFTSDSTKLKYDNTNYSISKPKFSFNTNGLKIYESPSFSSKTIEVVKDKNTSIELLEIGNLEKKGQEWDVWYKVRSNTKVGWCYGNLNY